RGVLRSTRILVGGIGVVTLALAWIGVHRRWRTAAGAEQASGSAWPSSAAGLHGTVVSLPDGFGTPRLYLDAGHGAPGNAGNVSSFCVDEEAFTLRVAEEVRDRLERLRHFELRVSRDGDDKVGYVDRLADARAWGADALVSIHSDVRGKEQ